MRPVSRRIKPDEADNSDKMREVLLDHWGEYCSYCEFPIEHLATVDHILPKKKNPAERHSWDNLHLSCGHCNPRKGPNFPTPATLHTYLWPSRDNTARAFKYTNVYPEVADGLTTIQQQMATRLHNLLVLGDPHDKRHKKRVDAFNLAKEYAHELRSAPDPALARKSILNLAKKCGFFSIWMEVFSHDVETRRQLIAAFPGTAQDCFDADTKPVQRPGGRL